MQNNKMRAFKAALLPCLCMLVCIAFWLQAAMIADDLQQNGQHVGMRYSSGGVNQKALNDVAFLDPDPLRANFLAWNQGSDSVTAEFSGRNSACTVLRVSGDPQLLYDRSQYRLGAAPMLGDEDSCMVSAGLAYDLWRSYDVLDVELTFGDKSYTVSGVLKEKKDKILLLQNPQRNEEFQFNAMEISQVPNENGVYGDVASQVQQFANAAQLPAGDVVIGYEGQALTLRQLALLPMVIILFLACFRIARQKPAAALNLAQRALRVFCILAVLVVGVWALSGWAYWPQNWRPAVWADFDFWGQQWQTTLTHTEALFSLPGYVPDLAKQNAIIKALLAIVAASLLVFPAHSRKDGRPVEKTFFSAIALLGAFALGLYMGSGYQRPIWVSWPLYWAMQALYLLLLPGARKMEPLPQNDEDF